MSVEMTPAGGPYRESQKPKDTWRIEVVLTMKSGKVHEYKRNGLDESAKNLFMRYHQDELLGYSDSSRRDRERTFRNQNVMFNIGFDKTIRWINCGEIESLEMQAINEREESERIIEALREQRHRAARIIAETKI